MIMATPRKPKITKTLIQQLLKESVFDPKTDGPFKLIVMEYGKDADYLEKKAKELLMEAQLSAPVDSAIYHDRMQKAIAIAVLARAVRLTKG